MTIADQVIDLYASYPKTELFDGVLQLHNPFDAPSRRAVITDFYQNFYSDQNARVHFLGINPSRLSQSSTGIHYTDGYALAEFCGIENTFSKTRELTSSFFYEVVERYGGSAAFFGRVFAWAALPVALTKDGSYSNYYEVDSPVVNDLVKSNIDWITTIPSSSRLVVLGLGKNKTYLENMTGFPFGYDTVTYVPHPRWIMQYNRDKLEKYIDLYLECIG